MNGAVLGYSGTEIQRWESIMQNLMDIVNREPRPEPWSEGDNIPWNDPDFSERMLTEHLSQDHDLASRRSETIDEHVRWIFTRILDSRPARLLDLGCGPGFYTLNLARAGCECVGIDYSPASIRHARATAVVEARMSCTYHQADLREAPFGEGFDLVMMLYGQFNVFPRDRGMEILNKAHDALKPGGILVLEVQSRDHIRQEGGNPPSWYSAPSGLFSDEPHLVLQENFWHEEKGASTTRFSVIDAGTGGVHGYSLSNEAYTEDELADALRSAGFVNLEQYPSLCGRSDGAGPDLPVIVARR